MTQPPGSTMKSGSLPDAGSTPWNAKISRTASQKEGVAMQAMENTRMI